MIPIVKTFFTNFKLVYRSKMMTAGILSELLALSGIVWSWADGPSWISNAALALATFGAFAVATKVAWDYQTRGFNDRQQAIVDDQLISNPLNNTQKKQVEESISLSGLTQQQFKDLPSFLIRMDAGQLLSAHQSLRRAVDHLRTMKHGTIAIVQKGTAYSTPFLVYWVEPPEPRRSCIREHSAREIRPFNLENVVKRLINESSHRLIVWRDPSSDELDYLWQPTSQDANNSGVVFSLAHCIPEMLDGPQTDEYVLRDIPDKDPDWMKI